MRHSIRPLTRDDEQILWEMVYHGVSGGTEITPHEVMHRPEFARFVQGWGRAGDTGFVAHDAASQELLGAVWLRKPNDEATPELAFAVKPGHRGHGIGSALLTQLVRAKPDESRVSVSLVAGKRVLRLYERFGFKVVEQTPDAVVVERTG
jgi:GNAT superfamily N-acetyltransferase